MKSRKFVALVLCAVMVLWQVPQFVFADEDTADTGGQETVVSDGETESVPETNETEETDESYETEASSETVPEITETETEEIPSYNSVDDSYTIGSAQDWEDFAARVSSGDVYGHYTLTSDITITDTVGTQSTPFSGEFDGNGYTITAQINDTENPGTAPFRYIKNAKISNLNITGSVTGGIHCAGLIGFADRYQGETTDTITNCTVSAHVTGGSHFGGIVGHCKSSVVAMTDCVFSGSLTGTDSQFIGGLAGWGDYFDLEYTDCFFCGTVETEGAFHPMGFMTYGGSCGTTFEDTFYTVEPFNEPFGYGVGLDNAYLAALSQQEGGMNMLYRYGGTTYYIKEDSELITDPVYLLTDGTVDIVPAVKFGEKVRSSDDFTFTIKDSTGETVSEVTETGSYSITAEGIRDRGYIGSASADFEVVDTLSGLGTEEEPYIIDSDMAWTKFVLFTASGMGDGAYYSLTDDITVTQPAGTAEHPFSGHFLGNGNTVTAAIKDTANPGTAPFRYVADADISSLNADGLIEGGIHAAGLAGFVSEGTGRFTDCSVSATVGGSTHIGGIIGHAKSSTIVMENCTYSGVLSDASEFIGGLIGWMESADITITGSFFCGAYSEYYRPAFHPIAVKHGSALPAKVVTDTYYTAAPSRISESNTLGAGTGIRVYRQADPSQLNRIVTIGGTDYYETEQTVITTDSPYIFDQGSSVSVVPVVTYAGSELSSDSYAVSITDSEGEAVGQITETGTYTLTITGVEAKGFTGSTSCEILAAARLPGSGTVDEPYVISCDSDWEAFTSLLQAGDGSDAYYELADSINVTVPAGTEEHPFTGTFDGRGYTINVNINSSSTTAAAPFRYIAGAVIKDLNAAGTVTGGIHAGGLVGYNLSGESTISDCTVSVSVSGSSHIGGIVGHSRSATLNMNRCIFNGTLASASQNAAGLIGWMDRATIVLEDCLFSGTNSTSGNTQFHPIALKDGGSAVTSTITDCYYLTDPTTTSGNNVLGSNVGMRLYSSAPMSGKGIYREMEIFDGNTYFYISGNISGIREYYHSSEGVDIAPVVLDISGTELTEGTDFEYSMTLDGEPVTDVSVPGTYVITADAIGEGLEGSSSFAFTVYPTIYYKDYVVDTGEFVEKAAPSDVTVITSSMTEWRAGWYVVKGNVRINTRVRIASSPVNLILADGATLTAGQGITVRYGRNFTVYAQESGSGSLVCYAYNYGDSALGAAKNYDSAPSDWDEGNNYKAYGNITINGGRVTADATATGYQCCAGIGGGRWEYGFSGNYWGSVTINGGTVVARGEEGAGIGGGWGSNGGNITIRGGNVTATSLHAAGMGEGNCNINFTWDSVDSGLRIRSSRYATPVRFNKGFKDNNGAIYFGLLNNTSAINDKTLVPCEISRLTYSSGEGEGSDIISVVETGEVTLLPADTFTAPAGMIFDGWKIGDEKYDAGSVVTVDKGEISVVATWITPIVPYVDCNGNDMPSVAAYSLSPATTVLTDQTSEWYAVTSDTEIVSRMTVSGRVNLILCDGATLSAHQGITVAEGNALTIWRQQGATGTIIIDDVAEDFAGIGGYITTDPYYEYYPCGDLVINGGVLDVTGGTGGAAIGGGFKASGGNITINGGDINVSCAGYGSCIGGGNNAPGGNITITGGRVSVTASGKASGIGGGYSGSSGNITITGGIVNAVNTTNHGACIGGGELGNCDTITITGGTVTATGRNGIGRGGSSSGSKGNITIGWTEETMNMSVSSSRYDSNVTLTGDFVDDQGNELAAGDYSSRTNLLANRTISPATDVRFAGYSLILDGEVGINFFMDLTKLSAEERQDGYMTFDITGKGSVTVRDDFDPGFREKGYYGFACSISSIQLADTITATYHYGEGLTLTDTYSASDYIGQIASHPDIYGQTAVKLAKSLADYGHYAQIMLADSRGWTIGTDYAEISSYYTDSYDVSDVRGALADRTAATEGAYTDIELVTFSVTMSSKMKINIYVKPAAGYTGVVSFALDGETCAAEALSDGRYKVSIEDLNAPALENDHVLTVTTGSGEVTVTFSGLSYVKALADTLDEDRQNAGCALYCFYSAAKEYQG